jgi:hypothetical protein
MGSLVIGLRRTQEIKETRRPQYLEFGTSVSYLEQELNRDPPIGWSLKTIRSACGCEAVKSSSGPSGTMRVGLMAVMLM